MSSATPYPITGIRAGLTSKQVSVRQEVDDWYTDTANKTQINLFFLALAHFQQLPVTDMKSYYQIAGIHGQPLVPWNEDTATKTENQGYCTHDSILFPTWHRPYLLLFEQRLHEIMTTDIIPQFPENEREELIAAANKWRMPYWDWAAKKHRESSGEPNYDIPLIIIPRRVSVNTPKGLENIDNPMYQFSTKLSMGDYGKYGLSTVFPCQYGQCKGTSRYPPCLPLNITQMAEWIDGVQNNVPIVEALRHAVWYESSPKKIYTDTLGEAVYRLFTEKYFSSYDAFASTRAEKYTLPPPDYLSLEDIHNNIHNWVGGSDNGGHMSSVPVAAFDPIFWLHHSNIDRLFAIWQTLNDKSWFDLESEQLSYPDGNWFESPNTIDTPKNPLAPFFTDDQGNYFNSNTARNWLDFGYTYPELQPWNFSDNAAYIESINEQMNRLYGTTRKMIQENPKILLPTSIAAISEHDDYVVNVLYERFALGGCPFTINIYVGFNKVGSVYNFSTPPEMTGGHDGCGNCQRQVRENALSKGQVHLTNILVHDVKNEGIVLGSLGRDEVESYLKERLRWTVTKAYREEVPLESIPSLKVSLAAGKGVHYKDRTKISKYHDYEVLFGVTEGRPGGVGRA